MIDFNLALSANSVCQSAPQRRFECDSSHVVVSIRPMLCRLVRRLPTPDPQIAIQVENSFQCFHCLRSLIGSNSPCSPSSVNEMSGLLPPSRRDQRQHRKRIRSKLPNNSNALVKASGTECSRRAKSRLVAIIVCVTRSTVCNWPHRFSKVPSDVGTSVVGIFTLSACCSAFVAVRAGAPMRPSAIAAHFRTQAQNP